MVSMGNVWDRTAEFLSDNLGTILPIALLAIFVPAALSGNFTELQRGAAPGLAIGLGIGSVVLALVTFWGQLAITALAIDPGLGKGASGVATRRFPAAVLVTIALLLAMLLLAIPAGVILALNGADFTAVAPGTMPTIPPGAGMWLALYFLVLIPLLFWVAARLVVVIPVIVGERLALGSIRRSWTLTRGVALRIVGVVLLYAIVSIVANLAATTAFGAIMYLVAGRGDDGLSLATVLTTIVGGAVSTAFTVLGTAFAAKLFVALLAREATPAS